MNKTSEGVLATLLQRKRVETLMLKAMVEWEASEPHQIDQVVRIYSEQIMGVFDGK